MDRVGIDRFSATGRRDPIAITVDEWGSNGGLVDGYRRVSEENRPPRDAGFMNYSGKRSGEAECRGCSRQTGFPLDELAKFPRGEAQRTCYADAFPGDNDISMEDSLC